MNMTPEMFARYMALEEPMVMDAEIRRYFSIPANRFYSVGVMPFPGRVIVDRTRLRTVEATKLSKSDSP